MDETIYRVSWFSNWVEPQHHENLNENKKRMMVRKGREDQYKVVVTLMTEDEPTGF